MHIKEMKRLRGTLATVLQQSYYNSLLNCLFITVLQQQTIQRTKKNDRPLKTSSMDHWHLVKLIKKDRRSSAKALSKETIIRT